MGKLRIVKFDAGDGRSHANVSVVLSSNGLSVYGTILQDGEINMNYAKKGNVVWTDMGSIMPVEETWVGAKNPGCEFRKPKKSCRFCDIVNGVLGETVAIEPINCEYSPKASDHWVEEMQSLQKEYEVEDFLPEDLGCGARWS